jgi:hypothetical protein
MTEPTPIHAAGTTAYAAVAAGTTDGDPAVIDLLGVLAHGALMASLRMAADADLAPTLRIKSAMAALAFGEFRQYEDLIAKMRGRGIDPETAMQPFVVPFAAYHERTRPSDWLEGLVKAYVGEGIAKDFYREMAGFVDADTMAIIVPLVRAAIETDPRATGRLSLWGRRLMGEALSQGQAVAVDRDALANLLVGGEADLTQVGEMFGRLQTRHQERMARLGLSA